MLLNQHYWRHNQGPDLGFVDDINVEGRISQVANDVQLIIDSYQHTGLRLNAHTCEITANNFELIDQYPISKDFKRTAKEDITFLGASVLEGKVVDKVFQENIADLKRSVERLSLLQAHDALCLLKNALAMPKLQYILRTSPCASNPAVVYIRWCSSQWTIQDPQRRS